MEALQYRIIRTDEQYRDYCDLLERLVMQKSNDPEIGEEIDLLTLLIEKWDEEHSNYANADPVELLKYLMTGHQLKATDIALILDVNKSVVSEILHYKKGFSKDIIRKLAAHFKVKQEAFNQPYNLISPAVSGK